MPTAGLLKKKVPPLKLRARLQAGLLERTIARQSEGGENIVAILLSTTDHTSFSEPFLCLFYLAFVFVFAM